MNKKNNYDAFLTIEDPVETSNYEKNFMRELEVLDISKFGKRGEVKKRKSINSNANNSQSDTFHLEKTDTIDSSGKWLNTNRFLSNNICSENYENSNEKSYIINNIETIYGQLEKTTPKISYLLLVLFLISFINFSKFWSLTYMISDVRTTYYCFDTQLSEFRNCYSKDYCNNIQKGFSSIIYIDNEKITNFNEENEMASINNHFRTIALYDYLRFTSWNRMKGRRTLKKMSDYSIIFAVNKNENYNIFSRYNLVCKSYSTMVYLAINMLMGLLFFGVIFGCFADVFGRKKILIILILFQIIGIFIIYAFDFTLEKKIKTMDNYNVEIKLHSQKQNLVMNKELLKDNENRTKVNENLNNTIYQNNNEKSSIFNFYSNNSISYKSNSNETELYDLHNLEGEKLLSDIFYFELSKLSQNLNIFNFLEDKFSFDIFDSNEIFQKKFHFMRKLKKDTFSRRKYFFENRAIFLLGTFLGFSTIPIIFAICLSYFMELSLNVSFTISNYKFLTKSYIFSYLTSYYMNILLKNYAVTLLILACFQLIIILIFCYLNIESPRYCYEVSDWIQLTKIIKDNFLEDYEEDMDNNEKILEKIVRNKEDPIYKQEITQKNMFELNHWQQFKKNLDKRIVSYIFFCDHSIIEKKINNEEVTKLEFKKFLKYPYLMYVLISRNKNYKDISFLIYSMVFNLAIVIFIIQAKFSNEIFISRSVLYNKDYINSTIIINFFIMLFSNYLFLFLDQILGYPIIMSLCYFFIFIFSLLLGLESIYHQASFYMKTVVFSLIIESDENEENIFLKNKILINSFFVHGLYFPLYLFLTKFTKTNYRVTYFGIINLIVYSLWMIAILLTRYFKSNYFFICGCCLVGFLISYFVEKSDDERIVKDFRILEKKNN